MVRQLSVLIALGVLAAASPVYAQALEPEPEKHPIMMYIPNRIFDVLDIVRVRARVGPGTAVSLRMTEQAAVTAGSYATIFAGIPGPRRRPAFNLPIGVENHAGTDVSGFTTSADGRFTPHYGTLEVGAGAQIVLLGFDVGVDPGEAVDFVLGFLTIDVIGDDY